VYVREIKKTSRGWRVIEAYEILMPGRKTANYVEWYWFSSTDLKALSPHIVIDARKFNAELKKRNA